MRKDGKANARAQELGLLYAKHIINLDDEVKNLHSGGSKFTEHFLDGIKSGFNELMPVVRDKLKDMAKDKLKQVVKEGKSIAKNKLKKFISQFKGKGGCACDGAGKKKRKKRQATDKMKRRNVLVKKIMKEKNMKMIEASKYIKQNNIEY